MPLFPVYFRSYFGYLAYYVMEQKLAPKRGPEYKVPSVAFLLFWGKPSSHSFPCVGEQCWQKSIVSSSCFPSLLLRTMNPTSFSGHMVKQHGVRIEEGRRQTSTAQPARHPLHSLLLLSCSRVNYRA